MRQIVLSKIKGEVCNLEFDPLYGSQDTSVTEMKIRLLKHDVVEMEYIYPPNNKKIAIKYKMTREGGCWLIVDVLYENYGGISLKNVLTGQ